MLVTDRYKPGFGIYSATELGLGLLLLIKVFKLSNSRVQATVHTSTKNCRILTVNRLTHMPANREIFFALLTTSYSMHISVNKFPTLLILKQRNGSKYSLVPRLQKYRAVSGTWV